MTATPALADKLAEVDTRQQAAMETTPKTRTLFDAVRAQEGEFRKAFPKHVDPERFVRLALTTLRTVPKLLECSEASIMAGFMQAAQFGLEIGGVRDQAHLIPRKNSSTGQYEASFQFGYRGLIDIAGRSGVTVRVRAVRDLDEFEYDDGVPPVLRHKPYLKGPRGDAYAYFCVATWADGREPEVLVMGRPEVEVVRDRFAPKKSGKVVGPWASDFDAMAYKTLIIRHLNYLPLPVEVQEAVSADELAQPLDVRGTAATPMLPPPASGDGAPPAPSTSSQAPAEGQTDEAAVDPIAQQHIDGMQAAIDAQSTDREETVQETARNLVSLLADEALDGWVAYKKKQRISNDPTKWSDEQARGVIEFVHTPLNETGENDG